MIRSFYFSAVLLATLGFAVVQPACGGDFSLLNPRADAGDVADSAASASSSTSGTGGDAGGGGGGPSTGGSGGNGAEGADGGADAGCTHGLCSAGAPLDLSCAPCVAVICDKIPSCCTDGWTIACVTEYTNGTCSNNCQTNFSACAHSPCVVGGPLTGGPDDACSPIAYGVCVQQQMPYCCTMGWDQKCVDAAISAAGAVCSS